MQTPKLDGILLEMLKDERSRIAIKNNNMTPFYICHDTSLDEMATYKPKTIEDLMKIKGIKKIKANQYGKDFISIIMKRPELTYYPIYTEYYLDGLQNSAGFLWCHGNGLDDKTKALKDMERCLELKIRSLGLNHRSTKWTMDSVSRCKNEISSNQFET
jgi:ribonuclease D